MTQCGVKQKTGRCVKGLNYKSDECKFRDITKRCVKIRDKKIEKTPEIKCGIKPSTNRCVKGLSNQSDKCTYKYKTERCVKINKDIKNLDDCYEALYEEINLKNNYRKLLRELKKKTKNISKNQPNNELIKDKKNLEKKLLKQEKINDKIINDLSDQKEKYEDMKNELLEEKNKNEEIKSQLLEEKNKNEKLEKEIEEKKNIKDCSKELKKLEDELKICKQGFYNQFVIKFKNDWTKYESSDKVYLQKYLKDPNRSLEFDSLDQYTIFMNNPESFQWKELLPVINNDKLNVLKIIIDGLDLIISPDLTKDLWLKELMIKTLNNKEILTLEPFKEIIIKIIAISSKRVSTFVKIYNPIDENKCKSTVFTNICKIENNTIRFKRPPKKTTLGYKIGQNIKVTEAFTPKDKDNNVKNNDIYKSSLLSVSLNSSLEGKKISVFNYGFSGTGKTHTSFNKSKDDEGIFIKFINENKDNIEKINQGISYGKINNIHNKDNSLSDNEFYEQLRSDVLKPKNEKNYAEQGFYNMISEIDITNNVLNGDSFDLSKTEDLLKNHKVGGISSVLAYSNFVSATANNPCSSRGHLYYKVFFKGGGELLYYDLAGSEKPEEIFKMFSQEDFGESVVDTSSLRRLIENIKSLFGLSTYKELHDKDFGNREAKIKALKTQINESIKKKKLLFESHGGNNYLKPWAKLLLKIDKNDYKINDRALDRLDIILESYYINKSLHELRKFLKSYMKPDFQDINDEYSRKMKYFFGNDLTKYDKALVIGHIRSDGDPVNDIVKYEGSINTLYFIEEIMKGDIIMSGGGIYIPNNLKKYFLNVFFPLYGIKILRYKYFEKNNKNKYIYDFIFNLVLSSILKYLNFNKLSISVVTDYVISIVLFYILKRLDIFLIPYFLLFYKF